MSEAPLLDTGSTRIGTGIPGRLRVFEDSVEVTTLNPPRRVVQRVSFGQIAQVLVIRRVFFADLAIETRGGGALRVPGMRKAAAEEARSLICGRLTET